MLVRFCEALNLDIALHFKDSLVDYIYNFNMDRLNVLDHFMLLGLLYNSALRSYKVLHNGDNLSDHEPVVMQLDLDFDILICNDKQYI